MTAAKLAFAGLALLVSQARAELVGNVEDWSRPQAYAIPGLAEPERASACGLIAAEAALRYYYLDPEMDAIREIRHEALSNGWWTSAGMRGPAAELALLRHIGIEAELSYYDGPAALEALVDATLDDGRPVLLSTPLHYFFIQARDGQGNYFVGHTGTVLRYGAATMSLARMAQVGGGVNGIVIPTLPAPGRPSSSVAQAPQGCEPGPFVAVDCLSFEHAAKGAQDAWLSRLLPLGYTVEDVRQLWVREHNRDVLEPGWRERGS